MEAVRTVFCYDSDAPLRLIRQRLLIDEALGDVPDDVPAVPLVQDVFAQQKRLRMAVRADATELDLDLRQPAHLEKSVLLHRLSLLGIRWGTVQHMCGRSGTFHELWCLLWQPEFAVDLIEASIWGSTLEGAAKTIAFDRATKAQALPELTALMEQILLADQAIRLLQADDHLAAWFAALATGAVSEMSHPLLAGRCVRILTEHGHWQTERAA